MHFLGKKGNNLVKSIKTQIPLPCLPSCPHNDLKSYKNQGYIWGGGVLTSIILHFKVALHLVLLLPGIEPPRTPSFLVTAQLLLPSLQPVSPTNPDHPLPSNGAGTVSLGQLQTISRNMAQISISLPCKGRYYVRALATPRAL